MSSCTDLAPDEHCSEDDLKTIEEVIADDDDSGSTCRPTLIWADGLDRWR